MNRRSFLLAAAAALVAPVTTHATDREVWVRCQWRPLGEDAWRPAGGNVRESDVKAILAGDLRPLNVDRDAVEIDCVSVTWLG